MGEINLRYQSVFFETVFCCCEYVDTVNRRLRVYTATLRTYLTREFLAVIFHYLNSPTTKILFSRLPVCGSSIMSIWIKIVYTRS
jgi:hypothetical protein